MTRRLVYSINNARHLIVLEDPLKTIKSFKQLDPAAKEAGGLLIGRHLTGSNHVVVDQVTTPTCCDRRSRHGFHRSFWHNLQAKRAWKHSSQTQGLLGLWHTHPEPRPTPSSVDFNDWKTTLQNGIFLGSTLFFMIVGMEDIRVWQGTTRNPTFKLLSQHE